MTYSIGSLNNNVRDQPKLTQAFNLCLDKASRISNIILNTIGFINSFFTYPDKKISG
jgi:hypothetical protein